MTVKELRDRLKDYPDDMPVIVIDSNWDNFVQKGSVKND